MILYNPHATACVNIAARIGVLLTWPMCLVYLPIGNNQALLLFVEEITFHV